MRNRQAIKNKRPFRARGVAVLILIVVLLLSIAGCGTNTAPTEPAQQADTQSISQEADLETAEAPEESVPDENGSYSSKEDVALYLHTYGKLPSNYITKKEAQKLGWQGGSLEDYAPGKCIGGDRFGNYEGVLPDEGSYHECDIDTLGKSERGPKRIVYSDDGRIYYTEDHYETFEQLY